MQPTLNCDWRPEKPMSNRDTVLLDKFSPGALRRWRGGDCCDRGDCLRFTTKHGPMVTLFVLGDVCMLDSPDKPGAIEC